MTQYQPYCGVLEALLMSAGFHDTQAMLAWRKLEHVAVQRLALFGHATLFLGAAVLLAGLTLWGYVFHRLPPAREPFWPGWWRTSLIVAFGAALPVALWAIATYATPAGKLEYGIVFAGYRGAIEVQLVRIVALFCTLLLGWAGMREVCRRRGMEVQRGGRSVWVQRALILVAFLGAFGLMAAFYISWEPELDEAATTVSTAVLPSWLRLPTAPGGRVLVLTGGGTVLILLLGTAACILIQCWRLRGRTPERRRFRRSVCRGLTVPLCLSLIFVGLGGNLLLGRAERDCVRVLRQPGHRWGLDELQMTSFGELREDYRAMERGWLEQRER